jgi:hypothetical protein
VVLNTGFVSTFDGNSTSSGDVLLKYTYYGDTNLDGVVDGSDYSRIDNAYLADQSQPGTDTGWFNGDFNYDGVVDGSDYTLIDNTFNSQGAAIESVIATAQISTATAVPEPGSLGIAGVILASTLRRRRR